MTPLPPLEDLFPTLPRCPVHSCLLDTFDDGSPAECTHCQSDLLDENEAA